MSEGLNQYVVYRLKRSLRETRVLRHQSYQYLKDHRLKVVSDNYDQIFFSGFDPSLSPLQLRRQIEKELPAGITDQALVTGDILAITRYGITTAYYVDPERLVTLAGFFNVTSSSPVLSLETTDYRIEGRPGIWLAAEEMWIDGQYFLLMQSQEFGRKAGYAVLDSHGKQVAEDTMKGFTDETIRQIRDYIKQNTKAPEPQENSKMPHPSSTDDKPDQSAAESKQTNVTSGNSEIHAYFPPKTEQGNRRRKKRPRRRKNGYIPLRHRESVLERLRQYQIKLSLERIQSNP